MYIVLNNLRRSPHPSHPHGFTLTELLVAIAIIAVLAAIVIPVSLQARAKAHETTCVSNMRQVYLTMRMYVDDNNDSWPSLSAWQFWNKAHPDLPRCPLVNDARLGGGKYKDGVPGYAMGTGVVSATVSSLPFPATTVCLCEQAPDEIAAYGPDPHFNTEPYPYGQEEGWKRHRGGAHYVFCDGHVKWFLPQMVGYNNYDPGNERYTPDVLPGPQSAPASQPSSVVFKHHNSWQYPWQQSGHRTAASR